MCYTTNMVPREILIPESEARIHDCTNQIAFKAREKSLRKTEEILPPMPFGNGCYMTNVWANCLSRARLPPPAGTSSLPAGPQSHRAIL